MSSNPFEFNAPNWLEDEILMIQTSGEMPEVALAESLTHLPKLKDLEINALRTGVAKAYFTMLERDLNPQNIGKANFRGLARALVNIKRLKNFFNRHNFTIPQKHRTILQSLFQEYLNQETLALKNGQNYTTLDIDITYDLAKEFNLNLNNQQEIKNLVKEKPILDHLGLRAIIRLTQQKADKKRKKIKQGMFVIETLFDTGKVAQRAALSIRNPSGGMDQPAYERALLVFSLTPGEEQE